MRGSALLLAALVAACGGAGEPAGPPRVGDALPALDFAVLDADSLSFSDLGGRPALVNLWATWCPPCRHEIPFLQSLHERFGPAGLRVIGVSADHAGAVGQVRDFVAETSVTYEIALDPRGTAQDAFRVLGLPATYLVDRAGVITLVRAGPVSEADEAFVQAVAALVDTP